MTDTLFDVTLAIIRELGHGISSVATGGSTSTVIDTTYLKDRYNDDDFNLGTVWIEYDAGGEGGEPQGEFSRVSTYVTTTGTITLASNLSAAVAAGDVFTVARRTYRLDLMIATVNRVLTGIRIPKVDETLTTAEDQLEYTLPATFKGGDSEVEVWLQGVTDDSDANEWFQVYDWYIKETATGTQKELVFVTQPDIERTISLRYYVQHPKVYSADDEIDESVPTDKIALRAAVELLKYQKRQPGVKNDAIDKHINELNALLVEEEWRRPVRDESKLATFGLVDYPYSTED